MSYKLTVKFYSAIVRMCHLMLRLICECGVLCKAEVVFLSCCGLTSSETFFHFSLSVTICVHAWEKWDRICGLDTEGFLCMRFISCLCQNSTSVGSETTRVQFRRTVVLFLCISWFVSHLCTFIVFFCMHFIFSF